MEMRRPSSILLTAFRVCCILLLTLYVNYLQAQVPVASYSIKNGKMFIAFGKDMQPSFLDSFVTKYQLEDLNLKDFIKTGSPDSLHKLGWKVDINNNEICVISKPLFSADNVNDPADKIIFTQKDGKAAVFPNTGDQVHFGYNRFKNKPAFAVSDSVVTFFLRGNTNANTVNLAGSFNNWQQESLPLIKTDSGWIAHVKLGAGKYWYKFVIDGNWSVDRDNANRENDGMGNDNSVYYKANYTFKLEGYTSARRIYLAGSFNRWKEKDLLMQRTVTGWELPVYLSEGTHTYRFIADGRWFTDPSNKDRLPNEFNDYNSVIRLGNDHVFVLNGYLEAQKAVLLGSFNNWNDNELFMNKTATGWELPYTLGPGNYEYNFKVDGKQPRAETTKGNLTLVIDPNFTFRLKGFENAKTVCLSGDLNNWSPDAFKMQRVGDEWIFKAHLNPGKHRYKFVVDGKWILDPANKLWEQNEHNTGNSVLWIDKDEQTQQ
jgi:hypothetical protein